MSIIIKGMKMPKTGVYVLSVDNTGKDKTIFTIAEHTHSGKIIPRHVGEAVPVPPHGRLIDADALKVRMPTIGDEYLYAREMIDEAPTIIEAEEEDNGN
jgi:hypothetical protein